VSLEADVRLKKAAERKALEAAPHSPPRRATSYRQLSANFAPGAIPKLSIFFQTTYDTEKSQQLRRAA